MLNQIKLHRYPMEVPEADTEVLVLAEDTLQYAYFDDLGRFSTPADNYLNPDTIIGWIAFHEITPIP